MLVVSSKLECHDIFKYCCSFYYKEFLIHKRHYYCDQSFVVSESLAVKELGRKCHITLNKICKLIRIQELCLQGKTVSLSVTSTHNAHVTVHDTDVEQTNDSTQKTKGTNYKQVIA